MTPRQKQVLDAYRDLTIDGVSPSMQEVADRVGLASKSGVHRIVEALMAEGLIGRRASGARNVRPIAEFSAEAVARMCHADLVALKSVVDRRLGV